MRITTLAILGVALAGPAFVGCDRTVSEEKKVDVKDDGTVKKQQTTVTEHSDGTVSKQQTETKSTPPR